MTLLEIIRKNKFATATVATPATDKPVLAPSVAKVASVAVAAQKSVKPATVEDIELEGRRAMVLAMLDDRPGIQRAFVTDTESNPDSVILTMAIRNQYSFEMLIPKQKYYPFEILEVIEKAGAQ